jgi:MFS family permease
MTKTFENGLSQNGSEPSGIGKLLGNRNFSAMFVGGAISDIGGYFTIIAVLFLALDITAPLGQAIATQKVATIIVFMILPSLFVGPFTGALVDRMDRKKVMYLSDIAGALTSFGLVYVAEFSRNIDHIYIFAVTSTIVRLFFYPARGASIPIVVGNPKDLVRANGFIQIFAQLSRVIGPAAAGFLIAYTNLSTAFLIDGISFFISAILIFSIRTDLNVNKDETKISAKQIFSDLHVGMKIIKADKILLFILGYFSVIIFAIGAIDPLFTAYLNFEFGLGEREFGLILSVSAITGLIGALLLTAKGEIRKKLNFIVAVSFIAGVSLLSLGFAPKLPNPIIWLYVGMAIIGLVNVVISIPLNALMQTIVKNEHLGKVAGFQGTAIALFQAIGAAIASYLAGFIKISDIYVMVAFFMLLAGLVSYYIVWKKHLNAIAIEREEAAINDEINGTNGYQEPSQDEVLVTPIIQKLDD